MFDCQIQKQKPQEKGQNGYFLELSRPKTCPGQHLARLGHGKASALNNQLAWAS